MRWPAEDQTVRDRLGRPGLGSRPLDHPQRRAEQGSRSGLPGLLDRDGAAGSTGLVDLVRSARQSSSAPLVGSYHNKPDLKMGPQMPTAPDNFKNALAERLRVLGRQSGRAERALQRLAGSTESREGSLAGALIRFRHLQGTSNHMKDVHANRPNDGCRRHAAEVTSGTRHEGQPVPRLRLGCAAARVHFCGSSFCRSPICCSQGVLQRPTYCQDRMPRTTELLADQAWDGTEPGRSLLLAAVVQVT